MPVKGILSVPGEKIIFSPEMGVEAERNLCKQTLCLMSIVTFPQLTALAQTRLSCHVFTAWTLNASLGLHFLCEASHVHIKIPKYKLNVIFLLICLMSV